MGNRVGILIGRDIVLVVYEVNLCCVGVQLAEPGIFGNQVFNASRSGAEFDLTPGRTAFQELKGPDFAQSLP